MIHINDYSYLRDHQCSLQETSKDTSKDHVEFMTFRTDKVINFDEVKRAFLNSMNESEEVAHSMDALLVGEVNNYFIEFKNGDARAEQKNIHIKARDSMMILNCILNRQIKESRKTDYCVLVYNEEKVTLSNKEKLAKAKAKKGNMSFSLFELGNMRGFCYKDVLTLSKDEFEKWISQIIG